MKMAKSFFKIRYLPSLSLLRNNFCSRNNLRKSWTSVLESAHQSGFSYPEIPKLLEDACNPQSQNFLHCFYTKYPFVQPLYSMGGQLRHPVGRCGSMDSQEYLVLPLTILLLGQLSIKKMNVQKTELEKRHLSLSKAALALYFSQNIHATVRNEDITVNAENLGRSQNLTVIDRQRQAVSKGNKIATLVGDLFITEMYTQLARVENNYVVKLMSDLLAESSQENFPSTKNTLTLQKDGVTIRGNELDSQLTSTSFQSRLSLRNMFCKSLLAMAALNGDDDSCRGQTQLKNLGCLVGELYYTHRQFYGRTLPGQPFMDSTPSGHTCQHKIYAPDTSEIKAIIEHLSQKNPSARLALLNLVGYLSMS